MQAISDLWTSRNQEEWSDALAHYWKMPTVLANFVLETRMDKLDSSAIKGLSEREWYDFLKDEYFPWKFKGNYLPKRLDELKKYEELNSLRGLFSIKKRLFAFGLANIPGSLMIAQEINGLGPAGASGLLAVLFPRWFGTADKFVVKALCEIKSLPQRQKLLAMVRKDAKGKAIVVLNEKDAVLLIDIMRKKATELDALFCTDEWTPRKLDMILWASRNETNVRCLSRTIGDDFEL